MSAPKGNQFWKLRGKHGRNKIITDPKALEENAYEYFQWCVDNPIIEIDFKGRDLTEVKIPHPRVFQKRELAIFCGVAKWETIESLKSDNEDFLEIITRIEEIIKSQKFRYATVGMFNQVIIARDLCLKDNSEVKQTIDSTNMNAEVSIDDLKKAREQALKNDDC